MGPKRQNLGLTSVRGVESGKGDHEEGGGVFASIDQVREGPLGVSVTPQALDEAEPGRQTLDDGAQAVGVAVTQSDRFCRRRKRHFGTSYLIGFHPKLPPLSHLICAWRGSLQESPGGSFHFISCVIIGCLKTDVFMLVVGTDSN